MKCMPNLLKNRSDLIFCGLLWVFAPGAALAEDVAGRVEGGIGIAFREPSNAPPYDQLQLQYDTGTVLHATVASHYEYGMLVRVDYAYTLYDALTASGLSIAEDIEQHDARGGVFYAPWPRGPVSFRIGGGYAWAQEDADEPAEERSQDGGFVETGLTVRAGKAVRFDIAAAGLKLEGDDDYDAEGAELRAGAAFDTGPLDVTLGARYVAWQREDPFDEELFELRIGLGGAWGYAENR
jgi:hypothetical protein